MTNKRPSSKSSGTQEMGVFTGSAQGPGADKGSGRGPDDDRRGLAAFEKAKGAPPSSDRGAPKGSARWSGGGSESRPPSSKRDAPAHQPSHDVDDELRRERLEAHEIDDDGMVAVSSSMWAEQGGGRGGRDDGGRGGRGRGKPQPPPEEVDEGEVEEEEAAPRKGGAWKWIGGGAFLLVVGAGVAVGVTGSSGTGATGADKPAAETVAAAKEPSAFDEEEAEPEAKTGAKPEANADNVKKADESAKDEPGEPKEAAAKPDDPVEAKANDAPAAKPDEGGAAPDKPAAPAAPTGPEPWAPAALAKNPWVAVAGAPAGKKLGLPGDEAYDTMAGKRTGFRPEASLMAPEAPFRIQAHEVTWGELALATTPPEIALAPRPKWLPRAVDKAAELPVTGLSWTLARAYCKGLGGDLPSEAEWEWAARGADDRYFPWGREALDSNLVRIIAGRPVPVAPAASSTLDRTPGEPGIHDLFGNAQEWTRDAWRSAMPADPSAAADPKATTHKAVRGWPLADRGAEMPAEGITYRAAGCADATCQEAEAKKLDRIGFRCTIAGG